MKTQDFELALPVESRAHTRAHHVIALFERPCYCKTTTQNLKTLRAQAVYLSRIPEPYALTVYLNPVHRYILGDGRQSYVVGYGRNPPTHVHHRAASCPAPPAACDLTQLESLDSNPHVLYGALVGSPFSNDSYHDDRHDYARTEVSFLKTSKLVCGNPPLPTPIFSLEGR